MRKYILYIVSFIFAFKFGVAAVWIGSIPLNAVKMPTGTQRIAALVKPRFSPAGRGCGNGYTQSYVTNDNQKVSEGVWGFKSTKKANAAVAERLRLSTVLEYTEGYKNHDGKIGDRYVLEAKEVVRSVVNDMPDVVTILFYDGSDSYRFIDAPTEDMAKEFEQYLISIDFKSPF